MSKHKQKKHKGPANRAKGLQPAASAAHKAETKVETLKPKSKKPEALEHVAKSEPKVDEVAEAKALEVEEPVEELDVPKTAESPKKSFFAGIVESVKKMVKSG